MLKFRDWHAVPVCIWYAVRTITSLVWQARRAVEAINVLGNYPDTSSGDGVSGRSNATAPTIAPDYPTQATSISSSPYTFVRSYTSGAAVAKAHTPQTLWQEASFQVGIKPLNTRERKIQINWGDGYTTNLSVPKLASSSPSPGDPSFKPLNHWYPNAYDYSKDYCGYGPYKKIITIEVIDLDDRGSHHIQFQYDHMPIATCESDPKYGINN